MKKLIFLFSFSILFQSCFSYKSVDLNSISIESKKKQNFKVEKLDRTKIKGQLVSVNEKTMFLENNKGLQTILKDEVYDIKVGEFSILKTGLVIAGVFVTYLIYAVLFTLSSGALN
jgi:hypothetical protein